MKNRQVLSITLMEVLMKIDEIRSPRKAAHYYTYTITRGTITQIGAGTREKISKHITPDNLCDIKILAAYENFSDAMKHALNIAGFMGLKLLPTAAVICNETKDIFYNARQAAEWAGTGEGNMSKHLKGIGSWKTLAGRTFKYVNKV